MVADALVLGCGLIGTSIGLALSRAGQDVLLQDVETARVSVAADRGAGRPWDGAESAGLVIVAVPPASIGAVLTQAQGRGLGQTYTHVASVQSLVQADLERLSSDLSQVVGGHPLSGRERSGPEAAEAGLFAGRPWAICPSGSSSPEAVAVVRQLAVACGAEPILVPIERHDRSVALLSHLPQVLSSALAGALADRPGDVLFELSGPGLADTTRLAGSDPELWTQVLVANAAHVEPEVRAVSRALAELADQLEVMMREGPGQHADPVAAGDPAPRVAAAVAAAGSEPTPAAAARRAVGDFLERGRRGRQAVPVKRGRAAAAFGSVAVEVDDRPGRLAALLAAAGAAGVNVEDVRVDHVPGQPRGVISLLVQAEVADALSTSLAAAGWPLVPGSALT